MFKAWKIATVILMSGSIYEKIKKFYDEGRDYIFISLWLASELDSLANEIQKLKEKVMGLEEVDRDGS